MENCRVCLKESDKHKILTAETRESFFQITSIYIDESDEIFQQFICDNCLKKLLIAQKFREDATRADQWFKEKLSQKCETKIEIKEEEKIIIIPHEPSLLKILEKTYICDLCSQKFNKKSKISNHMRTNHISSRPYVCPKPDCNLVLQNYSSYRKHARSHIKEWICEYCAKSFNAKCKLDLHTRIHTGHRPFKCDQCQADFKQQSDLRTHKKALHSQERNYVCNECGATFKIPNSLRSHKKRMHHQKGMFTCLDCDKKLMCKAELEEHVAIYHRGERNHACKFCPKTYTKTYHLKRHYKDNHKELYEKMIASGEIRIFHRSSWKAAGVVKEESKKKIEIVPTPPQIPIQCTIDNNSTNGLITINFCN